ncbi:MAG: phosphatase PAP2 family protein [Alphaproteobacteria bacterium]|nr:phosphatase PAP2 family protein [Alphaproteobacteria bacterium]
MTVDARTIRDWASSLASAFINKFRADRKTGKTRAYWIGGFFVLELILILLTDRPLAEAMKAISDGQSGFTDFFRSITDLGKGAVYIWPCGIATIFGAFISRGKDIPTRYRKFFGYLGIHAFFIFGTVGLSGIAVNIIKPLLGRARPRLWLTEGVYGFDPFTFFNFLWNSMPSGHSTTAFAVAYALIKMFPSAKILWLGYAVVLSLSRVIVDAHYLSDVLAGAAFGWLVSDAFFRYGMGPIARIIFPIDKHL